MPEENKIKLSEIVDKCLDFRQNPTEEAFKEIGRLIDLLDVRERLSLAEKGLAMVSILGKVKDNENPVECALDVTAGFFFFGTLTYVTNLSLDVSPNLMNIEVYDLLVTMGMEDHILGFCGKDNASFRKMLDDALNFSNIYRLVNAAKLISPEGIAELDKVLKGLKETLSSEKINEIRSLLAETDPAWRALKETVTETAVENALKNEVSELKDPDGQEKADKPEA